MKILAKGKKSINDGSAWVVGKWREEPDAPMDGEPCGEGLHSLKGDDPLKSPVFAWPCEVWEDECEGLCGEDKITARYRRQRIVREITDQYPVVVSVNDFITSLAGWEWGWDWEHPGDPETWMVVEEMTLVQAHAQARALDRAWARARAWDRAQALAWDRAWDRALDRAQDRAWDRVWDWGRAWAQAWDRALAWAQAGMAVAILVAPLDVDTTWLRRWYRAWELGYYPLREEGDKLVVARIIEEV